MKTQQCNFRATPEMHREIRRAADKENSPMSVWIRDAVSEKLRKEGKA